MSLKAISESHNLYSLFAVLFVSFCLCYDPNFRDVNSCVYMNNLLPKRVLSSHSMEKLSFYFCFIHNSRKFDSKLNFIFWGFYEYSLKANVIDFTFLSSSLQCEWEKALWRYVMQILKHFFSFIDYHGRMLR
jgi:hypothetical protein